VCLQLGKLRQENRRTCKGQKVGNRWRGPARVYSTDMAACRKRYPKIGYLNVGTVLPVLDLRILMCKEI
jgi:hypothetical protein